MTQVPIGTLSGDQYLFQRYATLVSESGVKNQGPFALNDTTRTSNLARLPVVPLDELWQFNRLVTVTRGATSSSLPGFYVIEADRVSSTIVNPNTTAANAPLKRWVAAGPAFTDVAATGPVRISSLTEPQPLRVGPGEQLYMWVGTMTGEIGNLPELLVRADVSVFKKVDARR